MSSSHLKSSLQGWARGIGIEVGTGTLRCLSVERKGGFLQINSLSECPVLADDSENQEALRGMCSDIPNVCLGLPSSSITDMFQNIPATLRPFAIDRHVQSQAHSIGSISDEQVIYDYQVMEGMNDGQKSLVISMVKEGVFEDSFQMLRPLAFDTHQVTSGTMAMLNSFFALEPHAAVSKKAQVLMLLREESTALAVVCGGGLQFACTLLFGSRNTVVSLKSDASNGRNLLESELNNALARWKEAQGQDFELSNYDIWITGDGGSGMQRFSDMLSSLAPGIEINMLGLPGNLLPKRDDTLHGELVVPFGLALQSIWEGKMTISLLPEQMKWLEHKKREYKFLRFAVLMLFLGIALLLAGVMLRINRETYVLENERAELDRCAQLLPQVEELHGKMRFQQKKMLPLVEAIYRSHCYYEALRIWQAAQWNPGQKEASWGIYLADEYAFARSNGKNEDESPVPPRNGAPTANLFDVQEPRPSSTTSASKIINVNDLRILNKIYIGGIVPMGQSRFKVLKDVQEKLLNSGAYVNVDDRSELMTEQFKGSFYSPWLNFLGGNSSALGSEYATFLLELPLSSNFIREDVLRKNGN
ncbi:MAG: hypothetical protein IJS08_06770 [Victivallales bacterium]|nr:hypothetical protein [Victivallales bacterium]